MWGKYIVTYVLPLMVILPLLWVGFRAFWLKVMPKILKGSKEIGQASTRYAQSLKPKSKVKEEEAYKPPPPLFTWRRAKKRK